QTDFESGLPPQITGGGVVTSSQGYGTGQFLQNTTINPIAPTTLTLTNLPAHTSIDLNFLLGIINTWDGLDRSPTSSPDYFNVTVDGVSLFHETFSNFDDPSQTYVPPPGVQLTPRIGPMPGDRFFDVFADLGFGNTAGDALYS